jgi:hypothetical protein
MRLFNIYKRPKIPFCAIYPKTPAVFVQNNEHKKYLKNFKKPIDK